LADSLVLLSFVTAYALPLLVCVVAGDIFAAEDHLGTWRTVLTRSRHRMSIFWAKTLAAATVTVTVVVLLAVSSTAAGLLIVGGAPVVDLSGTPVGGLRGAALVLASWATVLPPALAFTALGLLLSVATRSSLAGVVGPAVIGMLMQLYSCVGGAEGLRQAMLSTAFEGWHGLLAGRPQFGPLWTSVLVSAAYTLVCGAVAAGLLHGG
jgi:ABC-2 type transport system permease protein